MVNCFVKVILVLMFIIFMYYIILSIDLNTVLILIKIMNKTRTLKQLLSDDEVLVLNQMKTV